MSSSNHGSITNQNCKHCDASNGYGALAKRLTVFRDKDIGCDVEFVIGTEKEIIRAHRLILGCNSKVFETMFYGKMAQETHEHNPMTVVVPDVAPQAFKTIVDFLYSDFYMAVDLNDENVMQTLYAAKKYDVKALISVCIQYLATSLTTSNALCLLSQARFFDEAVLVKHCLLMIDANTDEVLEYPAVRDIDRDTLEEVLKRNQLNPSSELVVFKAVQSWSEAECERQEMEVNPSNQRLVLGPLLSLIRFPLMTVNEFGEAATSSLLNCEQIAQVFLHLTVVPQPPVSYPTASRNSSTSQYMVNRFRDISGKYFRGQESKFCFLVDQEILVSGFGLFGFLSSGPRYENEWKTEAEIQLFPRNGRAEGCPTIAEKVKIKGKLDSTKPVVASFSKPVYVPPNVFHVAGVKFLSSNVTTYAGSECVESRTVSLPFDEKITFHFADFRDFCFSKNNCFHDSNYDGQLPEIHFFVPLLEETY